MYALAVQHALETTSLPAPSAPAPSSSAAPGADDAPRLRDLYALQVHDADEVGRGNQNPYFLPWAMRGLLEEEFVKKELSDEVETLLGLFESWRPQGKGLKDVRWRLEAVRSKI